MNATARRVLTITAIALAFTGLASTANAGTWSQNHPRRAQVNGRLANQNHRINQDVRNGTITRGQARALHRDDHQIRQEERDMAHQDDGHITGSEQHVLNQQENGVSSQIPPK
jgi:hypothetical protein